VFLNQTPGAGKRRQKTKGQKEGTSEMHVNTPPPPARQAATFTGRKLDLMRAVRMDKTVTDSGYRVVCVILDHLNERTERTILSDETIAFECGKVGESGSRWVRRARKNVAGTWLKWVRTQGANIYSVNFETAKPFLAKLAKYRAAKREKFNKIADKSEQIGQNCPISLQSETPPQLEETQQNSGQLRPDRSKMSGLNVARPVKNDLSDRSKMSAIHLSRTPLKQEQPLASEESADEGTKAKLDHVEQPKPPSIEATWCVAIAGEFTKAGYDADAGNPVPDTNHVEQWLAASYDLPTVLGVIRSKVAKKKDIGHLSYFDNALAEAHQRRNTANGSNASAANKEPTEEEWEKRVKGFKDYGRWFQDWGGTPDSLGCSAPAHLLTDWAAEKRATLEKEIRQDEDYWKGLLLPVLRKWPLA
jgi:hypothetical protein